MNNNVFFFRYVIYEEILNENNDFNTSKSTQSMKAGCHIFLICLVYPLRKKYPNTEFFLVRVSYIRTDYGGLRSKFSIQSEYRETQ